VKLSLIGAVIITALLLSSKGLLPELPGRPKKPVDPVNISEKQANTQEDTVSQP
jgi:hypothetical protein